MRFFNTEGQCIPGIHYMVNLDSRLALLKKWIGEQKYLYMQEGRQYGKTTTLMALENYIKEEYIVLSLDFQGLGNASFQSEQIFSGAFLDILCDDVQEQPEYVDGLDTETLWTLKARAGDERFGLAELFRGLKKMCKNSTRPIVLLIDEVDSASNNQVFLDFLAQLRLGYIRRMKVKTFQSVILAGLYDIRNLKKKLRPEEEHDKLNSPWNIAAKFSIDMNFSEEEITEMLREYESDHRIGLDPAGAAALIFSYTSGYPYLVSAICKLLDEEVPEHARFLGGRQVWNEEGIAEAVKILLNTDAPIFGSLAKQMERFPEMKALVRSMLFRGQQIPFSPQAEAINMGLMFGYLKRKDGQVAISNRIFEMLLMNLFIAEEASGSEAYRIGLREKNQFIQAGRLDMDLVMRKFVQYYGEVFSQKDEKYLENFGREIFFMYLKPIINGTGNYYQESATRTMTRTDIIVDYLGEQFVIECKIWHGQEYNRRGEEQLTEYLDFYHKDKGYLLSFNFNKNKLPGIREIKVGSKVIVEAIV